MLKGSKRVFYFDKSLEHGIGALGFCIVNWSTYLLSKGDLTDVLVVCKAYKNGEFRKKAEFILVIPRSIILSKVHPFWIVANAVSPLLLERAFPPLVWHSSIKLTVRFGIKKMLRATNQDSFEYTLPSLISLKNAPRFLLFFPPRHLTSCVDMLVLGFADCMSSAFFLASLSFLVSSGRLRAI